MHWESYYVSPQDVFGDVLVFREEEAHHLSRVKRKKRGDIVWAVDGEGRAYEVELFNFSQDAIRGKILKTRMRIGEPVAEVTLAQGLLKGERFDWLVEKATEIGVRRIVPVISETSDTAGGAQKVARWKRVARSAMKQSGRSVLPEIAPATPFDRLLTMGTGNHYRFIAHSGPDSVSVHIPKHARLTGTPKVICVIGPEGGFTDQEIVQSKEQRFQPVTLGPRRLRAETAGLVLTTLVLSQLGEWK